MSEGCRLAALTTELVVAVPLNNLCCAAQHVECGFCNAAEEGPEFAEHVTLRFIGLGINLGGIQGNITHQAEEMC